MSAGLGSRQGWAQEPKACRAGPAPHCGEVVAGPFQAGARALFHPFLPLLRAPQCRLACGLRLGLGSLSRIESAPAGIWHRDPNGNLCLGLRLEDKGVIGDWG